MGVFNEERLLATSPKVLGEVLVTKNYDFIKPALVREGLGRLLGVGVLLAEGDEHKVRSLMQYLVFHIWKLMAIDPKKESYARVCVSSHKGPLSDFLVQVC